MPQTAQQKVIQIKKREKFGLNPNGKISDKIAKSELTDIIPPKNTMYPFGRTFDLNSNTGVRVVYEKGNMDTDLPNKIKAGYVIEKVKRPTARSGSQHTQVKKFDNPTQAKAELIKMLEKAKRIDS